MLSSLCKYIFPELSLDEYLYRALPGVPRSSCWVTRQLKVAGQDAVTSEVCKRLFDEVRYGHGTPSATLKELKGCLAQADPLLQGQYFPYIFFNALLGDLAQELVFDYLSCGYRSAKPYVEGALAKQPPPSLEPANAFRPNIEWERGECATPFEKALYARGYVQHRDRPFWNKLQVVVDEEEKRATIHVGVALPSHRCAEKNVSLDFSGEEKSVAALFKQLGEEKKAEIERELTPFFQRFFRGLDPIEGDVTEDVEREAQGYPTAAKSFSEEIKRIVDTYELSGKSVGERLAILSGENPLTSGFATAANEAANGLDSAQIERLITSLEVHARLLQQAMREKTTLPSKEHLKPLLEKFASTNLAPYVQKAAEECHLPEYRVLENVLLPAAIDVQLEERKEDSKTKNEALGIQLPEQFLTDYSRQTTLLNGREMPRKEIGVFLQELQKYLSKKQIETVCGYLDQGSIGDRHCFAVRAFSTSEGLVTGSDMKVILTTDVEGNIRLAIENSVFHQRADGSVSDKMGCLRLLFDFSDDSYQKGNILVQVLECI